MMNKKTVALAIPKTAAERESARLKAEEKSNEIADAIVHVAEGARGMLSSRLHIEAIVLLIQDAIPVARRPSRSHIREVLETAEALATKYVRRR